MNAGIADATAGTIVERPGADIFANSHGTLVELRNIYPYAISED